VLVIAVMCTRIEAIKFSLTSTVTGGTRFLNTKHAGGDDDNNNNPRLVVKEDDKNEARGATLYLLSGMIGSGKSTFSRILRRDHDAEVFSADEWMLRLYGADFPVERFQEHGDDVKALIWSVASRLLLRGVDVALDFSFWFRDERDAWVAKARALSPRVQTHVFFLSVPPAVAEQRRAERNRLRPAGSFFISDAAYAEWKHLIEPPHDDERAELVTSVSDDENGGGGAGGTGTTGDGDAGRVEVGESTN
jgi:predicted kinase